MSDPPPGNHDVIEELLKDKNRTSELKDLVREYISDDDIRGKTDLNDKQINLFWTLEMYATRYPEIGFHVLNKPFMHLRISRAGGSRKGMIEMLRGLAQGVQPQNPNLPLDQGRKF